MATQTTVRLVDDLDDSPATETLRFGLDGKAYEIDLNSANARKLRDALEEFRKAARVVTRRRGRKLESVQNTASARARVQEPKRARAPRGEAQAKRVWLAANGHPSVENRRGRFTAEQDAAWAAHEAGAEASEGGATVTARKRGGTQRKETVEAPQEPQEAEDTAPGKHTRVTGMTGPQVKSLGELLPDAVIENGESWVLLDGDPLALIEAVNAVRKAGIDRGRNNALASVVRKLREGDPKRVKVLDA